MIVEAGEKRVFLPEFIQWLTQQGLRVFLEKDYGERLDLKFEDYKQGNKNIIECSREEAFQQDLVLILRSPKMEEYSLLGKNSTFITMVHFPTRPKRVSHLANNGIRTISLDSIADYRNIRLVENMRSVAWNGLRSAFEVFQNQWTDLNKPDGKPVKTLIMGTGMVGKYAIDAATKLGNADLNRQHMKIGGNGAIAVSVGRNITNRPESLEELFSDADILVDATQRRDASTSIVRNSQLEMLPEHAMVVDLSVDPYALDSDPAVTKGIEGIPQGSLDKYVFAPSDPDFYETIPEIIPSKVKRHTVSCYSWPGVYPKESMEHYANQLRPLFRVLLEKGYDDLSPDGDYFEQALYNGTLKAFIQ